jgi:Family of unknown function (DUF6156)
MRVFKALIFIISGLNSCGYMQDTAARTRYYASFSGYRIPFRPAHELNPAEVKELSSYFVARYVGKRLMSFENIVDGARMWLDEYTYWPDGKTLQHRRMTKEDGSVVEQEFDRRGKIIQE